MHCNFDLRGRRYWCGAAFLLMFCAANLAAAGPKEDAALRIERAAAVVVARTGSVQPRWHTNAHGDRIIMSRLRLTVEETLKGTAGRELLLDVEGGTLDGFTLRVSGMPQFHGGERAVFLLTPPGRDGVHRAQGRGAGVLVLDGSNRVPGSSLHLDDLRMAAGKGQSR